MNTEEITDALFTLGALSTFTYIITQGLFLAFVGRISVTITSPVIQSLLSTPPVEIVYLFSTITSLTVMLIVFVASVYIKLFTIIFEEMQDYYNAHNK